MKKDYIFKTTLFLIPLLGFVFMSSIDGRTGWYSGSPGDNTNDCANCHDSEANFGATPIIETNIPVSGYELGETYNIKVEMQNSSASIHGYQLTAEKVNDNEKVGTFTLIDTDSQLTGSNENVTHTQAGNSKTSWNVSWTAPTIDEGEVKFYASTVAGNNNGTRKGDQSINTSSSTFQVLNISKENRLDFKMYPNPSDKDLTIQIPSRSTKSRVEFYDNIGRLSLSKELSLYANSVDVSSLSTGIYQVKVFSDDKVGTQKFIKK